MENQEPQSQEPQSQPIMEQVMELFYQGRRVDAQQLLARHLINAPQDAEAWFTMSKLVDDEDRRKQCLERALALQPDHAEAQWALTKMKPNQRPDEDPHQALEDALRNEGAFSASAPVSMIEEETQAALPAEAGAAVPQDARRPTVEAWVYPPVKAGTFVLLGAGLLLSLGMAVAGGFLFFQQMQSGLAPGALSVLALPGGLLLAGLLLSVAALIALTRRGAKAAVFGRLNRSGKIASGQIADRWTEWEMEDVSDVYMVSYLFELQRRDGGKDAFWAKQQVSKKLWDRLPPRTPVKIRYLGDNPNVSRLEMHYKL